MSTYQGVRTVSRVAGSAITIHRFVVFASGDGKYDHVGSAQGEMDGISGETVANDGDVFPMILLDGSIAKIELGATLSAGAKVGSDNVGRAVAAVDSAGNYVGGKILQGGDSGDIVEIQTFKERDQA
jgi:hypothetical protein